MCGILGLIDVDRPVAPDLYRGAMTLQHRGQDGAGITTFDGRFHTRVGLGLLADAFRGEDLTTFAGHVGLAHLRYATAGVGTASECQPFLSSYPHGLALVHNGNLTNDAALRERLAARGHRLVNSASDSETLLQVLADALARGDLSHPDPEAVLRAAQLTMATLEGAYAVVVLIANVGLLAFRDPHGIRPLVLGQDAGRTAFASESVALDALEIPLLRDVRPGEAVFVDLEGRLHAEQLLPAQAAHCAFEYVYLARPESVIDGACVSEVREALGATLAARDAEEGVEPPDTAFDVPSSAEDAAVAYARAASVPYRKGIRKNAYSGRSFIAGAPALRRGTVGMKFLFERRVIEGRHVAVVDDSIVRGTTARALIARLRRQGAKRIDFLSTAPPVRHPCVYGIDMAVPDELVAARMPAEEIAAYLGVDRLRYQRTEDLQAALGGLGACMACFTGRYPTPVDSATLDRIGAQRTSAGSADAQGDRLPTETKGELQPC